MMIGIRIVINIIPSPMICVSFINCIIIILHNFTIYEGGSICNENTFITPSTNALGFYVICQTKDQSVAVKMVHETLFYLTNFNKLQTF